MDVVGDQVAMAIDVVENEFSLIAWPYGRFSFGKTSVTACKKKLDCPSAVAISHNFFLKTYRLLSLGGRYTLLVA